MVIKFCGLNFACETSDDFEDGCLICGHFASETKWDFSFKNGIHLYYVEKCHNCEFDVALLHLALYFKRGKYV